MPRATSPPSETAAPGLGSSVKKEKRRRRRPANGLVCEALVRRTDTDALYVPSEPIGF
jgi:hypothetical protein